MEAASKARIPRASHQAKAHKAEGGEMTTFQIIGSAVLILVKVMIGIMATLFLIDRLRASRARAKADADYVAFMTDLCEQNRADGELFRGGK